MDNVNFLIIVVLLAVMVLGLAVYILAVALRGALKVVGSLSSQILTFKAHQQGGVAASAQVLRAQKLAGLAEKKAPKPVPPKEKPAGQSPFTFSSRCS